MKIICFFLSSSALPSHQDTGFVSVVLSFRISYFPHMEYLFFITINNILNQKGNFMRLLKFSAVLLIAGLFLLCGCSLGTGENTKLRDMEFTVLSEEVLPDELKGLITERKKDAFSFTYTDESYLYLCVGYGEQPTGGYSIAVNELYLTENAICVDTCLLGPSPDEKTSDAPSYPYIVIKTEYMDKTVEFQ